MSFKTKRKIEMFIFSALSFICFMGIGAAVGYFLGSLEKDLITKLNPLARLVLILAALTMIFLFYSIHICLHETGHMLFGLLTGYKFSSLRFGKLMLIKKDGKLKLCRFNMPGTGGQCIMTAPDVEIEKMPVVLYNLGGLIINLLLFLAGVCLFFAFKNTSPAVAAVCLIFALTGLIILITNGIPFVQLGTDGANTILLHRDINARAAFRNQLEVNKYLSDNYSIYEMPEKLFSFDPSIPMDNPLITAQALNYYNYLSAGKKFAEAKEMALYILKNAKSINQLHEKILYSELIFIYAVIDKDREAATEMYTKYSKELKSTSGFISVQRALYAYFSLVEIDDKKAEGFAKMFANSVKNYPYPKDAAIEQEEFEMVAEVKKECDL